MRQAVLLARQQGGSVSDCARAGGRLLLGELGHDTSFFDRPPAAAPKPVSADDLLAARLRLLKERPKPRAPRLARAILWVMLIMVALPALPVLEELGYLPPLPILLGVAAAAVGFWLARRRARRQQRQNPSVRPPKGSGRSTSACGRRCC